MACLGAAVEDRLVRAILGAVWAASRASCAPPPRDSAQTPRRTSREQPMHLFGAR